jgi:putative ATP-dependent endonuclease of OLD family
MYIRKVIIENFKIFKGIFTLELDEHVNILVGDNDSGKSTIIEAIHLALSGIFQGRYLKNELTQYLFNNEIIEIYLEAINNSDESTIPPKIIIELYFENTENSTFQGDLNSEENIKEHGLKFVIEFDEDYIEEYAELVKTKQVYTLPIEYYKYYWVSFARDNKLTPRTIPIKSVLIDSSKYKYQNGSDVYISHIVKELLSPEEVIQVSQSYREMKDSFMDNVSIVKINEKIDKTLEFDDRKIELSVELLSKSAWEGSLVTYIDDVPFHHLGQGQQSIAKTQLALKNQRAKKSNLILIEEPENHLSHSNLNRLLAIIESMRKERQVLITTHSNFVANKLGLDTLLLLHKQNILHLNTLQESTNYFFKKLSGYDTLRFILSKKSILVEGDSDELIIQRAYIDKYGKLPIHNSIDVISVGTSFLRFLEIAELIDLKVTVVTDNDGDIDAIKKKYDLYLGENKKENIIICFDNTIDSGDLVIGEKKFKYNTLEPKIVKENGLELMNNILDLTYKEIDDLHKYMKSSKTDCAIKIFESKIKIKYPQYIVEAIDGE